MKRNNFKLRRIHNLIFILFLILLYQLKILPWYYFLGITILFFILNTYLMKKKETLFSKGIQLLVSVSLVIGCIYLIQAKRTLTLITGNTIETYDTYVVVMKESSITKLKHLDQKKIGYLSTSMTKDSQDVLNNLLSKREIIEIGYESMESLSNAFYQKEIDALILEDIYRLHIETYYPDFEEETRIIEKYSRKEDVQLNANQSHVLTDTFTIYLSGTDTYGSVSSVSRSDVNMLVTIDPITHQILITSIPRDYYLPLAKNQQYDKLTHASLFGIKESMDTLSQFFDIEIEDYARINFTGLINIVDALGGVEVYSPYSFTTRFGNYQIVEGYNTMDGRKALSFVRERYALPNGDYDRGQNQQRLLFALVKKVLSPAILLKYADLMKAIADSFETSMSSDAILSLIQHQIRFNPKWQILNYQVKGINGYDWTYSVPNNRLYVVYPNQETVEKVKTMIHIMENHGTISIEE